MTNYLWLVIAAGALGVLYGAIQTAKEACAWMEQHVGGTASFRLLKPNPDHNHAFSYICQQYAGLFNFDPNFGHGTNERAVTALSMGIPIANNFNPRTDHLVGCYPYHFSDESIRFAAERLLGHRGEVPQPPEHAWEVLVGRLLRDIARPRHGVTP